MTTSIDVKALMHKFNKLWTFQFDMRKDFIVCDTGSCFRIFIKNTCSWMKNGGGCTMCNYSCRSGSTAGSVLKNKLPEIIYEIASSKANYPDAQIYMNGSYFNNKEIPENLQYEFLMALSRECSIRSVKVETRPNFVSKKKIQKITGELGIKLQLGIGIETVNDSIRNDCLNKGFNFDQYCEALNAVSGLCDVKAYLLFKPPFMSEKEAIEDTIESVRRLSDVGTPRISITPLAVQANTLVSFLLEERLYRPPWLWSLFELNSRLKQEGLLCCGISGLDFYPEPIAQPFNCERCTERLYTMLKENGKLTLDSIENTCSCRDVWESEIRTDIVSKRNRQLITAWNAFSDRETRSHEIHSSISVSNKIDCIKSEKILPDSAKECPTIKSTVDSVGITEFNIRLHINEHSSNNKPLQFNQDILAVGHIKAGVGLDAFHRGVHMSRMVRSIQCFSEAYHTDLRKDATQLCTALTENQQAMSSHVSFKGQFPLKISTRHSQMKSEVNLDLGFEVSLAKGMCNSNRLSLGFPIVNACPCTLQLSRHYFDRDAITHMQRGHIFIEVTDNDVTLSELLEFVPSQSIPQTLLRREDELYLVKKCYEPPEFCEDVCRRVSKSVAEKFQFRGGQATVYVVTEESIHSHSVEAKKEIYLN